MPSQNFSSLPTELVLSVADLLPIRSVACLALTCKSLYYNNYLRRSWEFGFDPGEQHCDCKHGYTSCCPGLDIKNHEPLLFLKLLERDLPSETVCDYCQRLHPRRETKKLEYGFWQWLADSCPSSPGVGMWLRFDTWYFALRFEDVQKVAKGHHWGESYGDPPESIGISTEWQVKDYGRARKTTWIGKFDVEPRILYGNVMLRTCQRMIVDRDELLSTAEGDVKDFVSRQSKVCHAGCFFSRMDLRQQVKKSMSRLRIHTSTENPLANNFELFRCESCLTEFSFALRDLQERGVEFVLSTWVNLGSCKNTYSAAWLGTAWHSHEMYSRESVTKAQKRAKLESGYVSAHDRSWVDPARYIRADRYPSMQAISRGLKGTDGSSTTRPSGRMQDDESKVDRHGLSQESALEAKLMTDSTLATQMCNQLDPLLATTKAVTWQLVFHDRRGDTDSNPETELMSTNEAQVAGDPSQTQKSRRGQLLSGLVSLYRASLKWASRS